MTSVFLDSTAADDVRRDRLFSGDLYLYSPRPAAVELANIARGYLEDAFAPHDPQEAQYHFDTDTYAAILSKVKPAFVHDPRCMPLMGRLMSEMGMDPSKIYSDLPRLRSATAKGYLTTGIAYAFEPHRDTWYASPQSQVNWWFPVYAIGPDNGVAFHPNYFDQAVRNSSDLYNIYEWNSIGRGDSIRPQPLEQIDLDPQIRPVAPVGGPLAFAAAQLHSSVPNTSALTRFSIDFRVVHIDDLESGKGAPNVDSQCTGTTLREFYNLDSGEKLSDEMVARYDDDSANRYDNLVFAPPSAM